MAHDIRLDSRGRLDEVIVTEPTLVHFEKMDTNAYWMRIEQKDGPAIVFWFETKKPPCAREE